MIVQSNIFCLGVCHNTMTSTGKVSCVVPSLASPDARHNQIPEVPLDAEQFLLSFL